MKKVVRFAILFTLIFSMFFLVTCKGGDGGGDGRTTENGTGDGGGGDGINVPSAPSDLTATADPDINGEFYGIYLTWTDNSDNESGFKVETKCYDEEDGYCMFDNYYMEIGTTGANREYFGESAIMFHQIPDGTYYHRVRAYNSEGNSDYSNEASVTIPPHD